MVVSEIICTFASEISNNAEDNTLNVSIMTKVVFRKFKDGQIIALFPDIKDGHYIMSYMHIGQHSNTDRSIVYDTKPATEEEYKELYDELVNVCEYTDLKVMKKIMR